jgi:hypothetical protein
MKIWETVHKNLEANYKIDFLLKLKKITSHTMKFLPSWCCSKLAKQQNVALLAISEKRACKIKRNQISLSNSTNQALKS